MSGYRYPSDLPKRRAGSRRALIEAALRKEIEKLRKESPTGRARTTLRFLFYRLVATAIVAKEKTGKREPSADVSVVLSQLRWADEVDFDEIVDRGRRVLDFTGWADLTDGAIDAIKGLRLDAWGGRAPLLIVESESLAGLLEDLAYEYRIPLIPSSGQSSDSLVSDAAGWVQHGHTDVIYVGDHDFSGPHIENSFRDRVEALTGVTLTWVRVALTQEQVRKNKLPVVQKYDKRTKKRHPAVETEALDQRILLQLIRAAIEKRLAVDLDEIERDEEQQRQALIARIEDDA